ncbi:MAG: cytochrome c [Burkholderiaceae bacterium]|nr:cytochrome c [Burkholderiaceae bacterium]
MRNLNTLLIGSMLAGFLAASAPAYADDERATQPVKVKTESRKKKPVVVTAPSVTPVPVTTATLSAAGEGRRLYLKLNCYGCHGDRGAGGMGPKVAHAEYGDVSEKVLQGAGEGMISYRAYVNTQDVKNIAAYLASIGKPEEPRFKDWWVAIPPK